MPINACCGDHLDQNFHNLLRESILVIKLFHEFVEGHRSGFTILPLLPLMGLYSGLAA